jgi:hypothetical protein
MAWRPGVEQGQDPGYGSRVALSNPLFFLDIARDYKSDSSRYSQELATLTGDPIRLTKLIAQQVHANANVAQRKFRWVNRAIWCFAFSLTLLAITAGLVARS